MSFKREGDDGSWLNILKRRRVSELFADDIPEDEALLTKNGRIACLVCSSRPVFDTIQMLSVHRAGKKHTADLEKFLRDKKELEEMKRIRGIRTYTVSKQGMSTNGDHPLLASCPYNPCVKSRKVGDKPADSSKSESRDLSKQLKQTFDDISTMRKQTDTLQEKIVLRPYTSKTRPVPNSAEFPTVRKDPALLNILSTGNSVITHTSTCSTEERAQTTTVSNSGFSYPASNSNLASSNSGFLYPASNLNLAPSDSGFLRPASNLNLTSSDSGFSYPASNLNVTPSNSGHVQSMSASQTSSPTTIQKYGSSEHVAVSKTGLSKDRFASNSVLQQPNFLARSRKTASNCSATNACVGVPERDNMKNGAQQVDLDPKERTRRVEAYIKAFQSGWKRSRDGTWVKDESAEFDSDEEPPDV